MPGDEYAIRIMLREEVDLAVEWAAREGWNPGLHDARCFHEADAGGFLVGLLDDEPVAAVSAVRYGESFGFVGFYIVKPEFRGRGYGFRIWEAAMRSLDGRVVGLDGVVAQQENYAKSGFVLAHRNVRYQGRCGRPGPGREDIVELSGLPVERVIAYDEPFFPDDRSAFLRAWIAPPEGRALGVVRGGELAGYGVARKCRSGYKIGPLFADDPQDAEDLLLALQAGYASGEPLYLDVPEVNPEAVALAARQGMEVVFETARMYAGPAPDLPLSRLFGVTSFELG